VRLGYFSLSLITLLYLPDLRLPSRNRRELHSILGYYAESSGNFVLTFRHHLSVQISRVQSLKMEPAVFPETSCE
jgi:hypothetical protein